MKCGRLCGASAASRRLAVPSPVAQSVTPSRSTTQALHWSQSARIGKRDDGHLEYRGVLLWIDSTSNGETLALILSISSLRPA